jgi:ribosomal protein S18 acetylase RimI-like enzyme
VTHFEIVPCEPDQWRLVRRFRLLAVQDRAAYPKAYAREIIEWTPQEWHDRVTKIIDTDRLWFATRDSVPVGMLSCGIENSTAELFWLFVDTDARKCGIARQLVDHAERHALKNGANRLRADIASANMASQALFTAAGFTVEPDSAFWWEDVQEEWWSKTLTATTGRG